MKKIFVSVTLLPDQEVNFDVLALNKKVSEKFRLHQIDTEDTEFAHISLYNAMFPEYNRASIENFLRQIFGSIQPIKLVPERMNVKSRFVSVVFEKTATLIDLQDKIIKALNPMREELLQSKYTEKPDSYSHDELVNAHTYGYPFCKDQFSPHMTIAELENPADGVEMLEEVRWGEPIILRKASVRILFTNNTGEKEREAFYFTF